MKPKLQDFVLEEWNKIVRETIQRAKQAKQQKHPLLIGSLETGVIDKYVPPNDAPPTPEFDDTRYVRFALNRYGRLSTPKIRGRKNPHRNLKKLSEAQRTGKLAGIFFSQLIQMSFAAEQTRAEAAGEEVKPIDPTRLRQIELKALHMGDKVVQRVLRSKRRSQHRRQSVARRINFGIIPGNFDKAAHASA